jgi:uncharacterized coiled-coil protein SlyX
VLLGLYASAKEELAAAHQKAWELYKMTDTTRQLDERMAKKWPSSRTTRSEYLELDILSERLERELERHPAALRLDEERFAASLAELKETVAEARATVQKLNTAVADEQLNSQQLRAEIHRLEENVEELRARRSLSALRDELEMSRNLVDFAADRAEREKFLDTQKRPSPQQQSLEQFVKALHAQAEVGKTRFEGNREAVEVTTVCAAPACMEHRVFSQAPIRHESGYCNCGRPDRGSFHTRLRDEQQRQWEAMMLTRLGPPNPFPLKP